MILDAMCEISICIPSRNEEFLARTVEDLLENIEADTEILIGLDGAWAVPGIPDNPKVKIFHLSESIGQRAITNQLVRLSQSKYIIKCDAHCAFDKGFDRKMLEAFKVCGDNVTMVPVMRNLHAFDWVCPKGHRRYQGPSGPCTECKEPTVKDVVWIAKTNPQSTSYRFDKDLHFQYFNEFKKRPEGQGELTETMSLQGSFFMLTREKYWELNICDEGHGSWGQQGTEVAAKTWLSGGRCLVNHNTWYAHMFRTQGGDFSFPYPLSGHDVQKARDYSKDLFLNGKWDKAIHDLKWLVEKFRPVPDWTTLSKGILYYTDNQLEEDLMLKCQEHISKSGLPVTSVSLKPMPFGNNFVLNLERSYATMYKQILKGLEEMKEDIVYFCEHDVLYHPNHFDFTPTDRNVFYYNGNIWVLRLDDGFAVHYNIASLSGLVCFRDSAIKHFRERVERIEKEGFSYKMGFEPFTHHRVKWDFWCDWKEFLPEYPNIDIAHGKNATKRRWNTDGFRTKPKFWVESTNFTIPGWDNLKAILTQQPK